MIVTLSPGANPESVLRALAGLGLWAVRFDGGRGSVCLLVASHSADVPPGRIAEIPGVLEVARPSSPHPLVDAQSGPVPFGTLEVGPGRAPVLIAGPCSIESEEQIEALAARVARVGGHALRGGGFKPRTSPYAFRGHGDDALHWIRAAADRHGLAVVSEALGEDSVDVVAEYADVIQIGSRNMHNYALLERAGSCGKPMLLKRGMAATLDEWLLAGEHCLLHGARSVVFCERGVRGFDGSTRNVLDLAGVAILVHVHRQPAIVDPSHALGRRDLVLPLSRAALAAGAAGLLVEIHERPADALSDGPQAVPAEQIDALARVVRDAAGEGVRPRPRDSRAGLGRPAL